MEVVCPLPIQRLECHPYENPYLTTFFTIDHKSHIFLNPGDEAEFVWGLPNSQSVIPLPAIVT